MVSIPIENDIKQNVARLIVTNEGSGHTYSTVAKNTIADIKEKSDRKKSSIIKLNA
jgi:hypothetical protein